MSQKHNRLILLLIFLIFATPVIVATLMHTSWWAYRPNETVNRGLLVEPAQPLDYSALSFAEDTALPAGVWTVLYPVAEPCLSECRSKLESLRQVHRATGRKQGMLNILPLLQANGEGSGVSDMLEIYPLFTPAFDLQGTVTGQLQRLGDLANDEDLTDGQAFLIDPTGNIMMRYSAGFDPNDLKKDLKRLLKWQERDD